MQTSPAPRWDETIRVCGENLEKELKAKTDELAAFFAQAFKLPAELRSPLRAQSEGLAAEINDLADRFLAARAERERIAPQYPRDLPSCEICISSTFAQARGLGSILASFIKQRDPRRRVGYLRTLDECVGYNRFEVRLSLILSAQAVIVIVDPGYLIERAALLELALIAARIRAQRRSGGKMLLLPFFEPDGLVGDLVTSLPRAPIDEWPWAVRLESDYLGDVVERTTFRVLNFLNGAPLR